MRKVLLAICVLSVTSVTAQFPVYQNLPSKDTALKVYPKPDTGLVIIPCFKDTTTANKHFVHLLAGAMILTGDDVWIRNSLANKWLLIPTRSFPMTTQVAGEASPSPIEIILH